MIDLRTAAAQALACLDLTNLDDDCDEAAVADLCARARTPHGPVAAVCVWPDFVVQSRAALDGSGIGVASVVNFPAGDDDLDSVREEVRAVVFDGADEIDLVVPWRALLAGHPEDIAATVAGVREVSGGRLLKAILETGELQSRPDPARRKRGAGRGRRFPSRPRPARCRSTPPPRQPRCCSRRFSIRAERSA